MSKALFIKMALSGKTSRHQKSHQLERFVSSIGNMDIIAYFDPKNTF